MTRYNIVNLEISTSILEKRLTLNISRPLDTKAPLRLWGAYLVPIEPINLLAFRNPIPKVVPLYSTEDPENL